MGESDMTENELEYFVGFAHRLADKSGTIIRAGFGGFKEVLEKSDSTPVTPVDREAEAAIRRAIEAEYPEHGIIGEELGSLHEDAEFVWVVDPIDGTKAFIAGLPVFGTLIALARHGVPALGVIDQPCTAERWIGVAGGPTTYNGRQIRVRECSDLSQALICTSSPDAFTGEERSAFERLRSAAKWTVYGGNCYAFGRIADGHIDVGLEVACHIYDYCALAPIVQGAGGIITDWQGHALTIDSGPRFLATGDARSHDAALKHLTDAR